jgi:hypothetical protein
MGAKRSPGTSAAGAGAPAPEPASTDEVNLEALSDEEIAGLLGDDADDDTAAEPEKAIR